MSEPTAYDGERHGDVLRWDRHCVWIHGRPVVLLSGEFHYWRVPDRDRWRDLLAAYRAAGLNAIRIYFHWGWHSPRPGVHHFDGNRDVDHLLRLCEELGLWVLAAPGPYICAETSGGGYPTWLIARREVRIRHMAGSFRKRFDPAFMEACRDWMGAIIPILAEHEITHRPDGCVIGLQIENELFEHKIIRLGLDAHMRGLAEMAREAGSTVPLFHNDAMPIGSWSSDRPGAYGVDLYAFDRYFVWAPGRRSRGREPRPWPSWMLRRALDDTERTIRGFPGGAARSPVFVAEAQAGWFNQWGAPHGFDEIHSWYGPGFARLVLESFAAQGGTIQSFYMFYGGTNWGTLGDPDVYTSYDYGTGIREHGWLSERWRRFRLGALFVRSFEEAMARSDAIEPVAGEAGARSSGRGILVRHRRSVDGVDLYFLRNLDPRRPAVGDLGLPGDDAPSVPYRLEPRESFVAVGSVDAGDHRLVVSTLPVAVRGAYGDGELWVLVAGDGGVDAASGELVFSGEVSVEAEEPAGASTVRRENGRTRISFPRRAPNRTGGPVLVRLSGDRPIFLVVLSEREALTLGADLRGDPGERRVRSVGWGPYFLHFAPDDVLEVEATGPGSVSVLRDPAEAPPRPPPGFHAVPAPVPGLAVRTLDVSPAPPRVETGPWSRRTLDWERAPWIPVDLERSGDPLDHGFTGGHVAYRCRFQVPEPGPLELRLGIRHRCTLWLNGRGLGGHTTYARRFLAPGAKNGPDPRRLGVRRYHLGSGLREGENELVVLVESLGQNRQPFVLDDVRNPRGILVARLGPLAQDPTWEIAGVDVQELDDPFDTLGFVDEGAGDADLAPAEPPDLLDPDDGVVWYRAPFTWSASSRDLFGALGSGTDSPLSTDRAPLRVRVEGEVSAYLRVNGRWIGRYLGELGPQRDFFVMDGLLRPGTNLLEVAAYTRVRGRWSIQVLPYRIDPATGNLDDRQGVPYATARRRFDLA